MPHEERTVFEFRAGPLSEADVVVSHIRGEEALSQPYRFDIDFSAASGDEVKLADLCGDEGLITLRRPGGPERHAHGILSAVRLTGLSNAKPYYRATLVPKLWRLRHVTNSRIFQEATVDHIVKQILDSGEVKHRWDLTAGYPTLNYCVQYRETDFDFVSRLLEEAGIFYFFEHEADGHTLVLVDAVGNAAPETPTKVHYRQAPGADSAEMECLFRLRQRRGMQVSKVALKDFDFERPALTMAATHEESGASPELEWYEYPGGFTDPAAGKNIAQVRLEERRFGTERFEGDGTCLGFAPGSLFEISDHPDDSFDRKLFLVRVQHEATQQESSGAAESIAYVYRNSFVALDAGAPYRPRRRTPQPRALPTTATVVGTRGEEIYTDAKAQVKVQFHWDRDGKNDEKSSCWMRCAQVWGGPGWGGAYLPRIGQEVLIKFLDGDPDRPILAGATYNGENLPPITLPDDKTQSTLRSDSSPGGGGFNEMRLEDQAGAEQVYLHAQKDSTIDVLADKQQTVRASESLTVAKDRSIEVHADQRLVVEGDETSGIGANQTLMVTGQRATEVRGLHLETVGQAQSVVVGGNRSMTVASAAVETVGAAAMVTVGGALTVTVGGAMTQAVGGLFSQTIGGARLEWVGLSRDERVGKNSQAAVSQDFAAQVTGQVLWVTAKDHEEQVDGKVEYEIKDGLAWQAKEFQLEADKLTIVVDGNVALQIDGSGNVTFGAAGFTLDASDLSFKGSSVTKGGSGSADSATPKVTQLKPMKGDKAFVTFALKDQDGNPVANEWFRAEFPDGTVREGRTDGSGNATAYGPKAGDVKISLPRRDKDEWGEG
jgi:type VI secretion system secreted protein VgrG